MMRARYAPAGTPRNMRVIEPSRSKKKPRFSALYAYLEAATTSIYHGLEGFGAAKAFVTIALVFLLFVSSFLVVYYVRSAPAFSVDAIDIDGLRVLRREDLLSRAQLRNGINIFTIAPESIRRRLLGSPWVATAEVYRILPHRFYIQVTEEVPVARVYSGSDDSFQLLSSRGKLLPPQSNANWDHLPLVDGMDPSRLERDTVYRSAALIQTTSVLLSLAALPFANTISVSEIHYEPDESVSLVLSKGTYVRLGYGPFHDKLRRLGYLVRKMESCQSSLDYVYLDGAKRSSWVSAKIKSAHTL